jgi:hypothetical protein
LSPVGTDAENGTALLEALSNITDASATNPYLLHIEPGTYDLGTGSLQMKEYVDIEGSGELTTNITSSVSDCSQATVEGADNAELRFLWVTNTSTGNCGTAVLNDSACPRLTQVTAGVIGGTNDMKGVYNENACTIMTNANACASGGATGGA